MSLGNNYNGKNTINDDLVLLYETRDFNSLANSDLRTPINNNGDTIMHIMAERLDKNGFESLLRNNSQVITYDVINMPNKNNVLPIHKAMATIQNSKIINDDFINYMVNKLKANPEIPDSKQRIIATKNSNYNNNSIYNNSKSNFGSKSNINPNVSNINAQNMSDRNSHIMSGINYQNMDVFNKTVADNIKSLSNFNNRPTGSTSTSNKSLDFIKNLVASYYHSNGSNGSIESIGGNGRNHYDEINNMDHNYDSFVSNNKVRMMDNYDKYNEAIGGNRSHRMFEEEADPRVIRDNEKRNYEFEQDTYLGEYDGGDGDDAYNNYNYKNINYGGYRKNNGKSKTGQKIKPFSSSAWDTEDFRSEDFRSEDFDNSNPNFDADEDSDSDFGQNAYGGKKSKSNRSSYNTKKSKSNDRWIGDNGINEDMFNEDDSINWEDYNDEPNRVSNPQVNDMYNSFVDKIIELLGVDIDTAKLYRTALKITIVKNNPELKKDDELKIKEMEKFFTSKKKLQSEIDKIKMDEIKEHMKQQKEAGDIRREEREKNKKNKSTTSKIRNTNGTKKKTEKNDSDEEIVTPKKKSKNVKGGYVVSEEIHLSSENYKY